MSACAIALRGVSVNLREEGIDVGVRIVELADSTMRALRGFGITRLLSYQVASLFAARRLKRVPERFEPPPWPVHIVHREGRYASAKVRAFVEPMAQRLRADPALA